MPTLFDTNAPKVKKLSGSSVSFEGAEPAARDAAVAREAREARDAATSRSLNTDFVSIYDLTKVTGGVNHKHKLPSYS